MPKTTLSFYLHIVAVAVIVFAIGNWVGGQKSDHSSVAKTESAYDRVMRTKTIRCGYYLFAPVMSQDANTGEIKGFAKDVWEEFGKKLDLKIEWTEKVDFPTMWQGLQTNRYDALCSPVWAMAQSSKAAVFTQPLFYAAVYPWVRGDDHRFDNNAAAINQPSTRIVTQDGNLLTVVAAQAFPQAGIYSMSPNVPYSDAPMIVGDNKADIILWDTNGVHDYLRANPGALRQIPGIAPLQIFPFTIAFKSGEHDLTAMFNTSIGEMLNNGQINHILAKWEIAPGDFLRVDNPYKSPQPIASQTQ
ncbi:MAG: transporter substrate-binding domain-containing protein [Alphaproteobacteria bacterium]|nr:MAG: transporter substrate-binding domain-containing protein [Alphaproteobacteria bacterium]